jgi:GT2 family glycosyltransferase
MPDALIITVNYKGADSTARFLESVSGIERFQRAHVIVVENGSCDGSTEKLRPLVAEFSNVELLESPVNRGYFGGANWALQQYLARGHEPDWVIICNNDILFDDCQFLSKLFERNPQDAAVIAPAIIARLTGADCNPFMASRPTRLRLLRIRLWHSSYYFMLIKQLLSPHVRTFRHRLFSWAPKTKPTKPSRIYGAHGAFLIFSGSYFEAGGYIDDGHFLYAEELCIAEICVLLGLRVVHDQDFQVWHEGHQATGRRLNRAMYEYARGGLHYALRKYFDAAAAPRSAQINRG